MNAEAFRGRGHGICREELQLARQNIGIGKQEVLKVQFDVREKILVLENISTHYSTSAFCTKISCLA
jgi:hypothetical protein